MCVCGPVPFLDVTLVLDWSVRIKIIGFIGYVSFWWWCSFVIDLPRSFCDLFTALFKVN
jgi:hypothetical protein